MYQVMENRERNPNYFSLYSDDFEAQPHDQQPTLFKLGNDKKYFSKEQYQLPLLIEMKIKFNSPAELHCLLTLTRDESSGIHLPQWQPAICSSDFNDSARHHSETVDIQLGFFYKFSIEVRDLWSTVYIGEDS